MKATGKNLRIVLIALLAAVMLAAAVLCSGTLFPSAAEGDAERDAAVAAFNGGLESEDGESLPAEWYFRERSTVKVDNAEYLEGKNSLYVVRDDYGSDFYMSSLNRIPVEGNTEYRFSYWIRSVGCDYASAIVKAVVYDEAGQQVTSRQSGETILNKDGENVSDWTEIFVTRRLPSNAAWATIEITVTKGRAEFWIDKVTARPNYPVYENFDAVNSLGRAEGWENTGTVAFTGGEMAMYGTAASALRWDAHSSCIYALSFDYKTSGSSALKVNIRYYSFAGKERSVETFTVPASAAGSTYTQNFTVTQAAYASIEFATEGAGSSSVDNVTVQMTYDPRTAGTGWQGAWVCYPANDIAYGLAGQNLFYRYTFEIPDEAISSAYIQFTADDSWKFWVNGTDITTSENNGMESWSFVSMEDIKDLLVPGKNVFAFEIANMTYYTGLLFDMTVVYQSGKQERFFSDETVLSALETEKEEGWEQPAYDDSDWKEVYVIGVPPCQPWNEVSYTDNSTISDTIEIKDAEITENVTAGEEGEVTFTLSVPKQLTADYDFRVFFWGKYSSDSEVSRVPSAILEPIDAQPSSQWPAGQDITVRYRFRVPDYVESGSYMLQFDPEQVVVTGSSSFTDNKLRGFYFDITMPETPLTTSEVKRENGQTLLYINGEATSPMIYMREGSNVFKTQYAQGMEDAGVQLICLPNSRSYEMNRSGAVWVSNNRYNFDPLDDLIYETLEGAPDAKLMIHLDAEPPQWWKNANPDECVIDSNGGTAMADGTTYGASYASEKWRTDVGNYYKAFIEHVLGQPYASHVFAVKVTAGQTVEWQWWGMTTSTCGDYSPVALNAFRAWLTEQYGTDAALQAAWGDDSVTLATAQIPTWGERVNQDYTYILNGIGQRNVIDYHLFYSQMTTDSILYFADIVKQACDGRWIVGTYNGYVTNSLTFESNNIMNAHIAQILASDDVDFLCAPIAYDTRMPGMSAGYMALVDSILNAGKMFFMECDSRTVYFEIEDMEPYLLQEWGKTYTLKDTIELMKRDFAAVLAKGVGLWWYDMYGGWFDDAEIYDMVSVMKAEMDYSIAHPVQNESEIAWVIDDDLLTTTAYNFGATYSVLYGANYLQKEQLAHIGAPYDSLYLSDLENGSARSYKVYLISAVNIDAAEKAAIDALKKDGVTILWYGIPGVYAEDGTVSADRISEITGIDLALTNESLNYNVRIVEDPAADSVAAGVGGLLYGDYDLGARNVTPMAYSVDDDAAVLGLLNGTEYAGLVEKTVQGENGSWTSVYSSVSNIPAQVIRAALEKAGGHIYSENQTDALFINSGYVGISSPYGGTRTIRLKTACDVYDVFAKEYVAKNVTSFTVEMEANGTRLFKTVPPGTVLEEPELPESPGGGNIGLIIGLSVGGAVIVAAAVVVIVLLLRKKSRKNA